MSTTGRQPEGGVQVPEEELQKCFLVYFQSSSGSSGGPRAPPGVNRKESYKAQKKSYAREKKRVERELLSTFKDESIIVLADWLKVRGSLKSWTKLWCVLKPGLLVIYRSPKTKVRC